MDRLFFRFRFCMDRSMMTNALALVLVLLVAGCASRGSIGYAPKGVAQQPTTSTIQPIFVATNRQKDTKNSRTSYGTERSDVLSYERFDVSIPPSHKVGAIEWPSGTPNPAKHFVTSGTMPFATAGAFGKALSHQLDDKRTLTPSGKKEAILYIHGYNTNFAEGLYRVAQLRHDYGMVSPMVLFSWPSAGRTGLYVYDRDSVKVSRDALVQVIDQLQRTNVEQITLVAHSLGSELLMESLRQIHLSGRKALLSKINGVVLLSPDLDIDVFNSQLDQIKPLPNPFMIFASRKDEALEISGFLTGRHDRVGNNVDLDKIQHPGVSVVDVTDFKGGDSLNHFTVATSPTLVKLLKGLRRDSPLESLEAGLTQKSVGSRVVDTATLPLRVLTTTTQAVFAR